ncbi:hypothetical protein FB565_001522 [Actinoplanes lutulentus]|uniref:Uncharacterized protein n=1 Tax=Actinoplanes lutulentus TaxID=1287878 RepID=A0A327ZKQ5_9ACTN|nr:hypothetical protein [Actinoplanes lutulentus]MBB2941818.1 hypothetical protein [Actinoplanes lutulentus]RAK39737.1 hypothetical protein B0I29_104275 [Actinoplanes lutulentus]
MNRTQNPTSSAADTTTEPTVTLADTLRGAARYLEVRGWHQGDYYAYNDRAFPGACVVGAIGMAAHGEVRFCPILDGPNVRDCNRAVAYLTGYLIDQGVIVADGDEWTTESINPSEWNDRDGQTPGNVIATLRAAADEYDWQHASDDDLKDYCDWHYTRTEEPCTREGFLAWRAAR